MNILVKHDGTLTNASCVALKLPRHSTLAAARKSAPAGAVFVSATTGLPIAPAKKAPRKTDGFVAAKIKAATAARKVEHVAPVTTGVYAIKF